MKKVKLLIADDHPIVRDGLRTIISGYPEYLLVGEACDGKDAIRKVLELKPDIVIMDIIMPCMDGMLATEQIKKSSPATKIIILSMLKEKEYVLRAFRAGADGYMVKDMASDELLNALQSVWGGKQYVCPGISGYFIDEYIQHSKTYNHNPINSLSLREKEVLNLIVDGNTNREIAEQLCVSLSTVKSHRNSIMKKLGTHDVASLTRLAIKKGFIETTD